MLPQRYITKSLFVDYRKLPKLARWKAHNPETYKRIRKLESEEQEKHIMAIWMAVEEAVVSFFEDKYGKQHIDLMPGLVQKSSSDDEWDDEDEYIQHPNFNPHQLMQSTLDAIRNEETLLYQPTFLINNCLVRWDMMVRNTDGTYTLCEIKAKTTVRKDMTDDGEKKPRWQIKKDLIDDMSFQKRVINQVLEQEWLPLLSSIQLRHLNKEYIKQWPLSLNLLLTHQETDTQMVREVIQRNKPKAVTVDDTLISSDEIRQIVEQMEKFLPLSEEEFNKCSPRHGLKYLEYFGEAKTDKFGTVMWSGIHHSNAQTISNLYEQWSHDISLLSDDEVEQFNRWWQAFIALYRQAKEQWAPVIDTSKVKDIVDWFNYPICFYDYESISAPIPFMDNTFPYQQVVVQYSLHKLHEDGKLEHFWWVFVGEWEKNIEQITIENNTNAVAYESEKVVTGEYKDLLVEFLKDIWDDINHSTFIVRHEWFENTRNKEIAKIFPDLSNYLTINSQTYDLKKVFEKNYYFDVWFKGSASIKKVLPVLVPSMSYDNLDDVQNGMVAMKRLLDLITEKVPEEQRDTTIINLLKYCGQDSLAMVKIFEQL